MARKPGSAPQAMRNRAAKTAAAMSTTTATAPQPAKKRTSPGQFLKEVRAEARKITWTTRRETWITSVMVAIMVVLASAYFFGVDLVISWAVSLFLKLANAG
ncbi:MAG: preprotein translocase subunit SecE [Phenylobacterium sp.]|uniref:preprotein translocase subunit SecE n=1 Tax=Phenylobacterium sp. TaxID=1871053 RepID=UPI0027367C2B|nr:preprotein translocase subunit SecE [Phenylobacterium sp.]MDP3173117.1 preprotein translocase subunit SecE [Phenylobacterium sp.]